MDRVLEKLANVSGSIGIAALAVAILLVPYSDVNAAGPPPPLCISTCLASGNPYATPPTCSRSGSCSPAQKGVTCFGCTVGVYTFPNGNLACTCGCTAQ